jgi:proteasome beta subunit
VPDASPFGSLPALPHFPAGIDPGPSFVDVLRRVSPHALPGAAPSGALPEAPHGTTVVAIRSADGVVMAGDRRATAGMMIASRRIDKVFAADDSSGVAIAGAAGPAIEMVRLFQVQLEHYEKVQGTRLSLEGKANQLSMLVRANFPGALQGMVVIPLFAGFDTARGRGRVFSYDITGGRYEELDFQAQGSGSIHARNWIKASWREGLAEDDAVGLAIRALFAAADEDAATGGPDLVRGIYPTMAVIDADGFRRLEEDDVAARSQELLAGPERGGTEAS